MFTHTDQSFSSLFLSLSLLIFPSLLPSIPYLSPHFITAFLQRVNRSASTNTQNFLMSLGTALRHRVMHKLYQPRSSPERRHDSWSQPLEASFPLLSLWWDYVLFAPCLFCIVSLSLSVLGISWHAGREEPSDFTAQISRCELANNHDYIALLFMKRLLWVTGS